MQKNKNVIIAVTTTVLIVGTTVNHIRNINKELTSVKKQLINYEKENKELLDSLIDKEFNLVTAKGTIEELTEQVKSLEKELKEKEYPTRKIKGSGTPVNMTMTFYGDFAHENGGYAGIDCNGDKLVAGTVASNYYPQGTQFEFNGQVFTVRDRGGSNFNNPNRLDVFVPRLNNESDSDYTKRIRHYGVKKVVMYKR